MNLFLNTFYERLRAFENRILANLDKIKCPVHLSLGAEDVSLAIHNGIRKDDWLFSTHRNHGHYLAKGGSEDRLWDEICGLPTGINGGLAGSQCFSDPSINFHASSIVGGSIGIACGAALALRGSGNVVVCVFGDAATEQGVFWESINFAVLKKLPIVFICENNGFSIDVPQIERQGLIPIAYKVKAFGMETLHSLPRYATSSGLGIGPTVRSIYTHILPLPCFIEARTHREGEHCYFPKQ